LKSPLSSLTFRLRLGGLGLGEVESSEPLDDANSDATGGFVGLQFSGALDAVEDGRKVDDGAGGIVDLELDAADNASDGTDVEGLSAEIDPDSGAGTASLTSLLDSSK
jgi:hypothetical protein